MLLLLLLLSVHLHLHLFGFICFTVMRQGCHVCAGLRQKGAGAMLIAVCFLIFIASDERPYERHTHPDNEMLLCYFCVFMQQ